MTTKPQPGCGILLAGGLVLAMLLCFSRSALAADTNAPSSQSKPAESETIATQDFLRSYLELQAQLQATQMAIQKIRQEAAAMNASNSAAVDERLRAMEKTIADQHAEQLSGIAHLGRTILIAAGIYACIGILGFVLAGYLQGAAINRLAAAANLSVARLGPPGANPALLPPTQAIEQSNGRLLDLIDRLEQRIHDLEAATVPRNKTLTDGVAVSETSVPVAATPVDAVPDKTNAVSVLVSKSQSLLKLNKAEEALNCLDEALALDANNADALVKKGAALEHLQRVPEAIDCYDQAIALDSSMTMAYLRKGSLYTRFERHGEALACYEQALKSGQAARAEAIAGGPQARQLQPAQPHPESVTAL